MGGCRADLALSVLNSCVSRDLSSVSETPLAVSRASRFLRKYESQCKVKVSNAPAFVQSYQGEQQHNQAKIS